MEFLSNKLNSSKNQKENRRKFLKKGLFSSFALFFGYSSKAAETDQDDKQIRLIDAEGKIYEIDNQHISGQGSYASNKDVKKWMQKSNPISRT